MTPECRPLPLPVYLNGAFWYPSPPGLSVVAVRAFVAGGLFVPSLSAAARFVSPVLFREGDDGDEGCVQFLAKWPRTLQLLQIRRSRSLFFPVSVSGVISRYCPFGLYLGCLLVSP